MRKLKKPISMFLTLLMIFSIVPVGNLAGLDMSWLSPEIKASAAGDIYEEITFPTIGKSKSTALSAKKNDIVITPKGSLSAEAEGILFKKKR